MSRCVIVHPEFGVFCGQSMGLGFFSCMDSGGQTHAPIFDDQKQAEELVAQFAVGDQSKQFAYFTVPSRFTDAYADTLVLKVIGVPETMLFKMLEAEAERLSFLAKNALGRILN